MSSTDGKSIQDGGIASNALVQSTVLSSTDGNVPVMVGTGGNQIKDSGTSLSNYVKMQYTQQTSVGFGFNSNVEFTYSNSAECSKSLVYQKNASNNN